MSALPARTIVLRLDEADAYQLAAPEPGDVSYDVTTVRRRFMARLRPQLAAALRDRPEAPALSLPESQIANPGAGSE